MTNKIEKWGVFEIEAKGHSDRNPFVDYTIAGTFKGEQEEVTVKGFYDGDGVYKVRFMPSFEGRYSYTVEGSFSDTQHIGTFVVAEPDMRNHGPVRANGLHFAYEDGTPYIPLGTTCYAWTHQPQELQETTIESLRNSAFNKIRFCIFPKSYDYSYKDPITFPYEGTPCDSSGMNKFTYDHYNADTPGNEWDFERFRPEHFQLIEQRIQDLQKLGIEADLILMHPYDRWGFSKMSAAQDDLYFHYVVARFGAYRNVWWSLANEYDLMPGKLISDWERFGRILVENDPYRHLRSIHNCLTLYDFNRPWITHCSIQRQAGQLELEFIPNWRETYKKPVVIDELCYEGNCEHGWGNITAKELVRRFWQTTVYGGYASHGETYEHPQDILWWSHGGELHGESPERLAFLMQIIKETPFGFGLMPMRHLGYAIPDNMRDDQSLYRLYYNGFSAPVYRTFHLDDEHEYEVEIIDTWNMTIEHRGAHKGKFKIDLPGKEHMAIRIRRR